ncbi:MAG TPA: pilin [Candidatus Magasanikbacteria bacterium]|nr:pilin [Candidatus Magasanikbacteria bacterium]
MKKYTKWLWGISMLLVVIVGVLYSSTSIFAICDPTLESCPLDSSQPEADQSEETGATTPVIGCRNGEDCVSLINPLATSSTPNPKISQIIGNTIQVVMGLVGSITFVVFVYGGVLWLTSAGNSERIQKGLQAMLWAGIGIIVVFSSYAIITLILTTLQASPN